MKRARLRVAGSEVLDQSSTVNKTPLASAQSTLCAPRPVLDGAVLVIAKRASANRFQQQVDRYRADRLRRQRDRRCNGCRARNNQSQQAEEGMNKRKRPTLAMQCGAFDYWRGAPLNMNPGKQGTKRAEQWSLGWQAAREQDIAEREARAKRERNLPDHSKSAAG
jgi:hypothetical protein